MNEARFSEDNVGAVLELYRWLEPVTGVISEIHVPRPEGPRRWWGGPLDVEGLALGSVQAALASLQLLIGAGNRYGLSSSAVSASFASFEHLRVDGRKVRGFARLSRYFQAADGWVRTHANYPHHEAALMRALGVSEPDEVPVAIEGMKSSVVEQRVRHAGGVVAKLRDPRTWSQSPMGAATQEDPWIDFQLGDEAPPRHFDEGNILSGVRVLDFTRVIAGPTGTRFLAALGADVLRIDPPHLPELVDQHLDTGFGKRSALADLGNPAEMTRVHDLLGQADIVFTGYRPDALARFGLDAPSLRLRYPHLAVVSLDAWGNHGPWSSARGFDSVVQAATGIGYTYGTPGPDGQWKPGALPVQALDHATGYGMAAAALSLLYRRVRGHGSGSAHLSLARAAHLLLQMPVVETLVEGNPIPLDVKTTSLKTSYGLLTHVPPPFTVDGAASAYPSGPGMYGTADLVWKSGV